MIDLKFIRENVDLVKTNCKNRKVDVDIDQLVILDKNKRESMARLEELRAKRNVASKVKPTPETIAEMRAVGEEIKTLEAQQEPLDNQVKELWLRVPNMTHKDVIVSDDEDANPVLEVVKEPGKFDFAPLDHVQLGEKMDLIDFERATKVSGAKFYYLKNELAVMEFALIQYALQALIKRGFTPFSTPDLAKREVLEYLGFNPRGESTQIYNVENSDLSLIGTAEITMGGYHMNEVLNEEDLPKKYVAVSHCFRTEAGSYSKFSKGMYRVHQFTKIEMFQYTMPSDSERAHQELLDAEKEIFSGLGIPFRVIDHCTADLGGPSIRTYDLEAWMPGKPNKENQLGDWGEITSTSNCTDYQARGLNIKYKAKDGTRDYVHMLNGTAIAIGRCLIAIMENNQQADGSILVPKALQMYCGFDKIVRK
ncbi:MAG: serine--tRNA ligase [bacterium]